MDGFVPTERTKVTLYIREKFESVEFCEPRLMDYALDNGFVVKNVLVCGESEKAEAAKILEQMKEAGTTCLIMRGMTHLSDDPIIASKTFIELYTNGIRIVTTKFYGIDSARSIDKMIFNIFHHYLLSFTEPYKDYDPIPIDPEEGHPELTDR